MRSHTRPIELVDGAVRRKDSFTDETVIRPEGDLLDGAISVFCGGLERDGDAAREVLALRRTGDGHLEVACRSR